MKLLLHAMIFVCGMAVGYMACNHKTTYLEYEKIKEDLIAPKDSSSTTKVLCPCN